jgi:hypothetical protein
MADLLDGLATTLEKHLGKSALNDMRTVSTCFRQFPAENVSTFCSAIIKARDGKPNGRRASAGINEATVNEYVQKVQHFLDNRESYSYEAIRQIVAEIGKLKVPEIKAIGERFEMRLTGSSKKPMLTTLENWLSNVRLSVDQTSFDFTGTGSH